MQALLLLSDYNSWPEFLISSYRSTGEFIDTSWVNEFLWVYAPQKEIKDKNVIDRMAHSFLELEQNEMIRSKVLTFPYRDFSEYAWGLTDDTP